MTLIEKLEKGPGSRELSDKCLLAVGWRHQYSPGNAMWIRPDGWVVRTGSGARPPDPSRNLQDTLDWMVPEGWSIHINQDDNRLWWAELRHGYQTSYDRVVMACKCTTPALALSTASLRAREAMKEDTS